MPQTKKSIFESYPKTTLLLFVVTILVILDGIAGLLFIPTHDQDYRVSDPYYHHGLLPNRSQLTHWGPIEYPIATNSLGFRDSRVREVSRKTDRHRILFIGDSHTEAVGVPFEESFTGRLRARMDTTRIEILNGAAVSYSPKLYYYKTKYLLEEVQLDVDELFVFIDISDVQNEYAYEDFSPSETVIEEGMLYLNNQLRQHSFIYYAIRKLYLEQQRAAFYSKVSQGEIARNNTVDLYHTFFSHFHDEVLLNNPEFHTTISEWYSDESLYQRWGKHGVELMTRYMIKLVNLCHQHRIPVTITVHPWRTQIRRGELTDRHTRYWSRFAEKYQLEFVNLYSPFIDELPGEEVIQNAYIPEDNHWTATGHQWVADKLFSFIVDADSLLLPPDQQHFHRGMVERERGELDQARRSLTTAITLNPTSADYHYQRGKLYLQTSEFSPARQDFLQALALDSTHRGARRSIELIPAYRQVNDYTRFLESEAHDSTYVRRGQARLLLGRYASAYDDFDEARKLNPDNQEAYYYLGYMKLHARQSARESIAYFDRAIRLDSGYISAYRQRAEALQRLGATERAAEDRKRAQQLSRSKQGSPGGQD